MSKSEESSQEAVSTGVSASVYSTFLPWVLTFSSLDDELQTLRETKPFPPKLAFGRGVSDSNRKQTRTDSS